MSTKQSITERFVTLLRDRAIPGADLSLEYRFHPVRRWRLDVAFPSQKAGIEVNGIGWGHSTIKSSQNDAEKHNALVMMGWRILVFPTSALNSKAKLEAAAEMVNELLCFTSEPERKRSE